MMNIIYKTLVEIMLLHEFYLTDSEGETIFDRARQADKINYLLDNYDASDPNITDDLAFEPTALSQTSLKNQHLRILKTYSGFKIVMEVVEKKLPDGTTVYQPMIALADNFNINIRLTRTDHRFDSFCNSRLQRNISPVYYFSNENVQGAKTGPSLSNSIPAFNTSFSYEMGELAFKDNVIKQFINDGSADPWVAVTDNGYINETDRLLVPFAFNFSFDKADNVTQADFVLKDNNGTTIKTIQAGNTNPLQQVALDFSDKPLTTIEDVSKPVFYTLSVSGSNNYTKQYQLLFFADAVSLSSCWGFVNIKSRVQTAAFNLIDDSGYLFTRIPPASDPIEAPIFEIRIKSRLAYWWYTSNNRDYKLKISSITQDYLTNSNGVLKTKKPRAITYTPILFTTDGNSFQNLPNPQYDALLFENSGQFYKNVLVSQSTMFPVEPV
jgi:hypothetical protein